MERKTTNILISNISTVNFRNIGREYTYGSYRYKGGEMTNIPPIQLLRESLKDRGQMLDYLILMESDQVRGGKVYDSERPGSMEEFLKVAEDFGISSEADTHHAWLDACLKRDQDADPGRFGEMPEIEIVDVKDSPTDAQVVASVDEVRRIIEGLAAENRLNIYIEANGGVRYVLFMLVNIISTIQQNNSNIELASIVNMVFGKDNTVPIDVQDVKSVYMSIQLFSAVNEFINYGRVVSLREYFNDRFEESAMDKEDPVRKRIFDCISRLEIVAEDLQLCRSEFIMDDFYGSSGGKKPGIRGILHEFRKEYPRDYADPNAKIFNLAIDMIDNEYELIYKDLPEDGKFNTDAQLPQIIRWCLDKDYIQQALTFCSERLPNYLFNAGMIKTSKTFDHLYNQYRSEKKTEYEYYYHILVQFCTHDYIEWVNCVTWNALARAVWKQIDKGSEGREFRQEVREIPRFGPSKRVNVDFDYIRDNYKYIKNNIKYIKENRNGIVNYYAEMITDYVLGCYDRRDVNDWGRRYGIYELKKPGRFGKETEFVINDLKYRYLKDSRIADGVKYILQSKEICENRFGGMKILGSYSDPNDVGDVLKRMMAGIKVDKALINNLRLRLRFNDYANYFDGEGLSAGIDKEKLREILIIYYFLKEQRNMSNHASTRSADRSEALDMYNLKKVIDRLLRKIKEVQI